VTASRSHQATEDWTALVDAALTGDEAAWRRIVDGLSGVVWKVLMSYALNPADREDAYASTFFRLYEKLHTVNDPRCLPGWIGTAARNEANALWRRRKRAVPTERPPVREAYYADLDERLIDGETLASVMQAFGQLPAQAQALLRLLTAVPPLSYDEISIVLGMPKGSIGPTGGRLLEKLRCSMRVHGDKDGVG